MNLHWSNFSLSEHMQFGKKMENCIFWLKTFSMKRFTLNQTKNSILLDLWT